MIKTNKSRLRRQLVCFPFVGDSIGGAHISSLLLIKNLPHFYRPIVIVHENGPLTKLLKELNISYHILLLPTYVGVKKGILFHLVSIAITTPKILFFIKKQKIDIVHAQDTRMNLTWVIASWVSGIKFVWHQRSKVPSSRLLIFLMRFAKIILFNSNYCASTAPKWISKKMSVVSNPFDTLAKIPSRSESRSLLLNKLNLPMKSLIIGFVGNFTKQKRPFLFIEAAAKIIKRSALPIHFVMFGSDKSGLSKELKQKSKELNIENFVHLMGFVYPIEPMIVASDLILVPEVEDAFGRTLVEAMLLKTPVVASNSGGHCEVINHGRTGYLVLPDDSDALAEYAISILNEPEKSEQVAINAREKVCENFSIEKHLSKIIDHYKSLYI